MVSPKYKKCVVIVHGKSELCLVNHIYTNLHLPVAVYAKDKGKSSIQINGLPALLKRRPFSSLPYFAEEFSVEYDRKTKTLKNFKLYIVMDTDDCTSDRFEEYKTGTLFSNSALKEYIVPIYNIQNLEDVLTKTELMPRRIPDSEKGKFYSKIFPINNSSVSQNTIDQVHHLLNQLKAIPNYKERTNLPIMIQDFLDLLDA